jgi:hypothetical protein
MHPTSLLFGLLLMFACPGRMLAAEDLSPALPSGTWEVHGKAKLRGQDVAARFWLRLLPTDPVYGRNRILQVVYTPPPPAALGGTHLSDTPFVLLDPRSRLMAWNDRGSSSQMQPATGMYIVGRDRTTSDDTNIIVDEKKFSVERGWDRSLVPLLLALLWQAESTASLPCVDLFGDAPTTMLSWHGPLVTCGQDTWRVVADANGRLAKLLDAQGGELVSVSAWLATGTVASPTSSSEKSSGAK